MLFDFDGTLNETGPGIFAATRAMMREFNVPDIPDSEMIKIVGPPLKVGFSTILRMDEATVPAAVARYREIAKTVGMDLVKPYPGVLDMMRELKALGALVGIVTAKVHSTALEQIELFGFAPYTDYVRGAYPDGRGEKPELLRVALDELELDRSSVVMVGDRYYDISAAVQSGVDSIGVLYGYGSEEELRDAGATYIVRTVEELSRLLIEDQ